MSNCEHSRRVKHGKDRYGRQRYKCLDCGSTFTGIPKGPLHPMRMPVDQASQVLMLLAEGNSVRSVERVTGVHRDTVLKALVAFGARARIFLDKKMQGLQVKHLQFDEQWTYIKKKGPHTRKHGEIYIWTCVDKDTKLMPCFKIGEKSSRTAELFVFDVASRIQLPKPHASDGHHYKKGEYKPIVQISTDGYPAYINAINLAFGPYVRYGTILKEYYKEGPQTITFGKRTAVLNMRESEKGTICTNHVERTNGTQRLLLKRLNRLTLCFSKKRSNLIAAFTLFCVYYNFCWRLRLRQDHPLARSRPTPTVLAGLETEPWSFQRLFNEVVKQESL